MIVMVSGSATVNHTMEMPRLSALRAALRAR